MSFSCHLSQLQVNCLSLFTVIYCAFTPLVTNHSQEPTSSQDPLQKQGHTPLTARHYPALWCHKAASKYTLYDMTVIGVLFKAITSVLTAVISPQPRVDCSFNGLLTVTHC